MEKLIEKKDDSSERTSSNRTDDKWVAIRCWERIGCYPDSPDISNIKVWVNTEFTGHWPVGTSAVVTADSVGEATALLNLELVRRHGLPPSAKPEQFKRVYTNMKKAVILQDGDY